MRINAQAFFLPLKWKYLNWSADATPYNKLRQLSYKMMKLLSNQQHVLNVLVHALMLKLGLLYQSRWDFLRHFEWDNRIPSVNNMLFLTSVPNSLSVLHFQVTFWWPQKWPLFVKVRKCSPIHLLLCEISLGNWVIKGYSHAELWVWRTSVFNKSITYDLAFQVPPGIRWKCSFNINHVLC